MDGIRGDIRLQARRKGYAVLDGVLGQPRLWWLQLVHPNFPPAGKSAGGASRGAWPGLWLRHLAEKRNFLQGFNPGRLSKARAASAPARGQPGPPREPEENWPARASRHRCGAGHGLAARRGYEEGKTPGVGIEKPNAKKSRGKHSHLPGQAFPSSPKAPSSGGTGRGRSRPSPLAARGCAAEAVVAGEHARSEFSSF